MYYNFVVMTVTDYTVRQEWCRILLIQHNLANSEPNVGEGKEK